MQANGNRIFFHNRNDPYYEFTNFLENYPFFLDGMQWPTSEHYFQAQKYLDLQMKEEVRCLNSPRQVFDFTRSPRGNELKRKDWDQIKDFVMERVVEAKFLQHENLFWMLINTANAELIEHTSNDNYWADGGDGSGRNQLGKTLMKVRDRFNKDYVSMLRENKIKFPEIWINLQLQQTKQKGDEDFIDVN